MVFFSRFRYCLYVRPLLYSSNSEQASSANPGYFSLYHAAVPMNSCSDLNSRSSRYTADRPRSALLTSAVIGVGARVPASIRGNNNV